MTQLHLCISSWETTNIFPIFNCVNRDGVGRGGGVDREKWNKSKESQGILKRKKLPGKRSVFFFRLFIPDGTLHAVQEPLGPLSKPLGEKDHMLYKHLCPANTHSRAHPGAMLAAASGQSPGILGASSRTWDLMGKKGNRMLAGQQTPNPIQFPQACLLWWLLAQKARFTNMKCSKRPVHPQHSFFYLLSWVGE